MLVAQLVKALGDLLLEVTSLGVILKCVGARELLNLPQSCSNKNIRDVLPEALAAHVSECVLQVASDGGTRTFECSNQDQENQVRYCEARVARSVDENFLIIVSDVSVRKIALLRAQESELRFRTMADHAPAMLWVAGIDGECEFFNKTWLEFSGRTLEQELGTRWAEGVHFEDFQNCMALYLQAFVTRTKLRMEYRLRNAAGEYRWILDQGVPRYAPDGSFLGFIGSCIDITESKTAEQRSREHAETLAAALAERSGLLAKLQLRSRELARSNNELEQFVYAASHDLRAPLRAIDMLSKWIENDLEADANPEQKDQLQLLRRRVVRMTRLLDDLLEYARVGRETVSIRSVDTCRLLTEIVEMVNLPTSFKVVLPAELPILETPQGPLKQVFMNLIVNAFRHHDKEQGKIEIGAQDQGDFIEFAVVDDGPGIPGKFHEKVFQVFQTLKPRDRVEGSGVGLALVKKAVETAGGKISLHSEGRGSAFAFTWPKRWSQRTLIG